MVCEEWNWLFVSQRNQVMESSNVLIKAYSYILYIFSVQRVVIVTHIAVALKQN